MKTTYDQEIIVQVSDDFIQALHDLMRAEMKMMISAEPENADCWTWGVCAVGDLASSKHLVFEYGGNEDKPKGMESDVMVQGSNKLDEPRPTNNK